MKITISIVLFFAGLVLISSCNKGPTGGIPFYMKMDTAVVVAPHNISASSNTQGIQDVWVSEGPNNIGAYELPCLFPVLDHDSVQFVIQPGVWQSSQSTDPVIYPLMNPAIFTLYAKPGNTYNYVPTFTYKTIDTIQFNEDFEFGSDYNANMTLCHDSVKYGHLCGQITVGPNDSSVIACQQHVSGGFAGSACPYALTPGEEIWIELDYKSQVPFWAGVIAASSADTIQILFLLPTETWTKEYIKISETVGQEGPSSYSLFFQGLNPSGFTGGSVYLDNIRLIHAPI